LDFSTVLYEVGRLKPGVNRVFSLRDAAAAHCRMDAGQQFRKIVLVPWAFLKRAGGDRTRAAPPGGLLSESSGPLPLTSVAGGQIF